MPTVASKSPILSEVLYLLLITIIALTASHAGYLFPEPIVDWVDTKMILIEDLDGDGNLDLATANPGADGTVSVFLGNGDGTYQSALVTAVGNAPGALAAGDLNGDSDQDLVIPLNGSNEVRVLLGNGDGTFAAQTPFAAGADPSWAAVGLFNSDAMPDLVVTNRSSHDVSIYMGNGDGTFGTEARVSVGDSPVQVVTGQFNGDGFVDLAVANRGADNVSILLGNGNGTFGTPSAVVVGRWPISLAAGNVDGNADLDLVVALQLDDQVAVLANDGNGSFSVGAKPPVGRNPVQLSVGDLNGDTHLDIGTANLDSNDLSILLGNGDGTFQPESRLPVGLDPNRIAMGDLDKDHNLDLAVRYYGGVLVLFFGHGDGTFVENVRQASSGSWSVAAGDIDGDGHQDVATAGSSYDIGVLFGNGDGTFGPASFSTSLPDLVDQVTLGDFTGDDLLDLAVLKRYHDPGGVWLLPNLGGGAFGSATFHPAGYSSNWAGAGLGDFNTDGRLDLAVPDCMDAVAILIGKGDGTFEPEYRYAGGSCPTRVAVGDFNEDGRQDLVVTNHGYRPWPIVDYSIFLGRGDGTFEPEMFYETITTHSNGVAVADLNGDGHQDIVTGSENWMIVAIHHGYGDGTFSPAMPLENPRYNAGFPVVGDFDLNTIPDIMVPDSSDKYVALFSGEGAGSFADPVFFDVRSAPSLVAVADFDENGTQDLAVGHHMADAVAVLLNRQVASACLDSDGDGFGYPGNPACAGGLPEDCDDSRGSVYPGAVELCDGLDNDCDRKIDEGYDTDGDFATVCNGDCNDANPLISGFTVEICDDGLDNDCDGFTDGGVPAPSGTPSLTVLSNSISWTVSTSARVYDVVKGDAQTLHDNAGDFGAAVLDCGLDDYRHTSTDAVDVPAVGQIWWYLVRGGNCAGSGTYDSGGASQAAARDSGIDGSPSSCP
jgi:hypothetical protein